jgi:hypothetical protein
MSLAGARHVTGPPLLLGRWRPGSPAPAPRGHAFLRQVVANDRTGRILRSIGLILRNGKRPKGRPGEPPPAVGSGWTAVGSGWTALNDPAPNPMLVASPCTTRTEPSSARSRAASSGSCSATVSDRARAVSGAKLEHPRAEVDPVEGARQHGPGHVGRPPGGAAAPPVVPVHGPQSSLSTAPQASNRSLARYETLMFHLLSRDAAFRAA